MSPTLNLTATASFMCFPITQAQVITYRNYFLEAM